MITRNSKVISWREPPEWKRALNRELRKQGGVWRSVRSWAIPWLLLTALFWLRWRDAEPDLRAAPWQLPLYSLGLLVGLGFLVIYLPSRLHRQRLVLGQRKLEYRVSWDHKNRWAYDDLAAFWIETEEVEGTAFRFFCWLPVGEDEEECVVLANSVSEEEVRALLLKKGVQEMEQRQEVEPTPATDP